MIYFAHPVSDYDKPRERKCLELISSQFKGVEILNPNQQCHNDAYRNGGGMDYFEKLVLSCDILVMVPFEDYEYGMGVWREAESCANHGGKVFALLPGLNTISEIDFKDIRPLSINETRKRVKAGL